MVFLSEPRLQPHSVWTYRLMCGCSLFFLLILTLRYSYTVKQTNGADLARESILCVWLPWQWTNIKGPSSFLCFCFQTMWQQVLFCKQKSAMQSIARCTPGGCFELLSSAHTFEGKIYWASVCEELQMCKYIINCSSANQRRGFARKKEAALRVWSSQTCSNGLHLKISCAVNFENPKFMLSSKMLFLNHWWLSDEPLVLSGCPFYSTDTGTDLY